jgi:hypothetical protein
MAESGKNCVQCGRPVAVFSGITVNGAAYHSHCWHYDGRPVPKTLPATGPDEARFSGGGYSDRPDARPRVMPVVEQLQLGQTPA